MAWNDELPILLRYMVFDIGPSPVYSDSTLQSLFLAAAQLIQTEISFSGSYAVDIVGGIITPDPTVDPGRDNAFINLTLAKAGCLIDNAEARLAAKRAVIMRDANKLVDLTEVSRAKIALWKNGWCNNYKTIKFDYLLGNAATGIAIIGPFRLEMNWMPGPWTPDGDGIPLGTEGSSAIFGGNSTYGRYR
jgi:hypothetical protein